ncbi:hypothetical protein [Chitinophaga barathri]|uniref:Apea-like HEPN domain-containing protein n=1 Tax=Chitinophaga barathri TaxID=1647451 RepID=A0A3N4N4Q6_9BACT|nr:hypothetical protein [Chitinophaga barathri]RPD42603.1 hypothetical protein EG028_05380 [Chitinophaga barathri]
MQNITIPFNVNPFERLFIDKGLELLFKNSVDTYRLRLHNPKTLIEELVSVCQSSALGLLTNNDYASAIAKELSQLINEENHSIIFQKVSKKHFIDTLSKISNKNNALTIQSCKLILSDNTNYVTNTIDEIINLTSSYTELIDEDLKSNLEKKIVVLTNHFFVELVNSGYNKQYLYNFFQVSFVRNSNAGISFNERVEILKTLIAKPAEEFTIIYKIVGSSFQFIEFKKIDSVYELVNKRFRKIIEPIVSEQVNEFLTTNKLDQMITHSVSALDYLKAIELSLDKVSKDIDIYHLGLSKNSFKIDEKCAVIGKINPQKSATFPCNFQIDGYFRSNATIFEILLDKINKIKLNNTDRESFDKILSAIRYYRTGSESPELETKLLNYWIGLEYIFTSTRSEEKTIERIRTLFPKCHSLIYVKRNLHDFHRTLERLNVSIHIDGYSDDLEYLTNHATYQQIIDCSPNELLKFRAKYFRKWVEAPNNIQSTLRKHEINLTHNFTRLYRIRNEIVHNAAIKRGIYVSISHMKYYLTFILNSILDFMAEQSVDTDNDGKVSIDDYFIAQEIMLGSLNGGTIKEYIKIDNPAQIIY